MASLRAVFWILSVSVMTIGLFRNVEAQAIPVEGQAKPIGVCYGRVADNLPNVTEVIEMYKQYYIGKLRLYRPDPDALTALKGTGIEVIVGVPDEDLSILATGIGPAQEWVNAKLKPYYPDVAIKYLYAGNEVVPGELAKYVAPSIGNLQSALQANNINIPVTTAIAANVLGVSYPPSAGAFSDASKADIVAILQNLKRVQAPLIVHIYPYFPYSADPANVKLDYALFTAPGPVVSDGALQYQNLFDAMLDAFYSALEREGFGSTNIIVGETGWPTAGNGDFTNVDFAQIYNRNFLKKVLARGGTPKRPNIPIDGYFFAMFNEDKKAPGVERHWGLFYPDKFPVYRVFA